MRKARCTKCKQRFYSMDPKVTKCQDCDNKRPDLTEQQDKESASIRAANASKTTEVSQTVDIKAIAKNTPKRKPRKSKGASNGTTPTS